MANPLPFSLLGFLLLFLHSIPLLLTAESPSCLAVYKKGGAPAVFQSPDCPRWTLLAGRHQAPLLCHAALNQGRRRSQEDRVVCALGMRIPFLGRTKIKEVDVGLVAVFDGHNGAEASDMASKLLLDYFLLHIYFLLDGMYSKFLIPSTDKLTYGDQWDAFPVVFFDESQMWEYQGQERYNSISSTSIDSTNYLEILKESLLRAIHDIDSAFSKEAVQKNLQSGTTATVLLIADGQILAANIGDSKALLCSEDFRPRYEKGNFSKFHRRRRNKGAVIPLYGYGHWNVEEYDGLKYYVKELTMDHHPDREDEKRRVEAAGGYVTEWAGVVRVNGELAVSRAIGDVGFKKCGVTAIPEVTDWQHITTNDTFLVAASDGIFEKMTTQEVCDLLLYEKLQADAKSKSFGPRRFSLADALVNNALQRDTVDNMAAVVIPLGSTSTSGTVMEDELDLDESSESLSIGLHEASDNYSGIDSASTSLVPVDTVKQMTSKLERLMVESEYKKYGCFYLAENLDENMDYIFQTPKKYHKGKVNDMYHELVESDISCHGRLIELYKDHNMCRQFGIYGDDKGQCTCPNVFTKFLGLLDSIPYSDMGSNTSESFGYSIPRYILKRRFDHGSYGEVWLAFHWNCSEVNDVYSQLKNNASGLDPKCNSHSSSSNKNCSSDQGDGNLFILKRIMVERGTNAYLSGLREKYFGEIFLNASVSLGISQMNGPKDLSVKVEPYFPHVFQTNISDEDGVEDVEYLNGNTKDFKSLPINQEEGLNYIARFVEYFESKSKEIWLVFRNEGFSLSKLVYTAQETKLFSGHSNNNGARYVQVLHPSTWWHWLRTTEAGQMEMKNLIWQLLMALKACHDRNIIHRDIKPENMIICLEDPSTGRCSRDISSREEQSHLKMRIIDFGSAIDDYTVKHLYGSGPTRYEQTFEYTPPEALLNASWFQGPRSMTLKYDMWSVGVVMLELIIGSPHVFEISDRTRVLLDQHLEGWSEHTKELAYKLRSYMEMCILIPGISTEHYLRGARKNHNEHWPASWRCSEESFAFQVKSRDPLKIGFQDIWALRLVRQLLVWHPEDRLSVDEALDHPYFGPDYGRAHRSA